MAPISAEKLIECLRASSLFTAAELQVALAAIPREDRNSGPAIAAHLVRSGKVTLFQAKKLLAGVSKGMVLGPFRILAPIGRGGMGKVYLARNIYDARPVALKVLPPHRAREEERLVARFLREMEMCREVDHPNLAKAYQAGVAGEVHYIALEFVPGMTLSRAVSTGGPLRPDVAARLFHEAADGLEHAHNKGLIHRDMKPSNLMITPAGHAKILDLGLALREGEEGDSQILGGKGYIVGTMDYVSPEQSRNSSAVDFRSDLYGLGGTMFYAFTGRPPFPGGTGKEKMSRQRKETPPRVEEYNGDVPSGFADLIDSLLAKNPEDRPASAAIVRDRLLKWAGPPAPPDIVGDTAKILTMLNTDPAKVDDVSLIATTPRDWTVWAVVSGVVLLLVAIVAVVVQWWRR